MSSHSEPSPSRPLGDDAGPARRSTTDLGPLAALLAGPLGAWGLGLGVLWIDVELASRSLLDALPEGALDVADALYGSVIEIHPPAFVYCIF